MRIYIVQVNDTVSSIGYKTLEEAQEFIKNRVDELQLINQGPYYDIVSVKNGRVNHYIIRDIIVEEGKA